MRERNRLGYRIRLRREKLRLSKSEFSRRVGVTPTAVHNWEENGVVPRPNTMSEIAKVLGVSEAFLVTGAGELPETTGSSESGLEKVSEFKRQIADTLGVHHQQIEISVRL